MSATSYKNLILGDGPAAYWQCNEASGNLTDAVASAIATSAGSGTTYQNTGPLAANDTGAIAVNGSGYFTFTSAVANYDPNNDFTVECWFKPTSASQLGCLIGWATNVQILMSNGTSSGSYFSATYNGLTNALTSSWVVPTTHWTHGVFTFSKNGSKRDANMLIFQNGIEVNSSSVTVSAVGSNRGIGSDGAGTNKFSGQIAHVALYNYALTDWQVKAHYVLATGA